MAFARRSTRRNTDLTQEKLHYVGWDEQAQKDVLDDFESEKGHSALITSKKHSQKTTVQQDQENQSSKPFVSKGIQKQTKERYVYAEGNHAGQLIPKNANIQRSGLGNNAKSYFVEEKNGKVIARHRVLCERYYLLKTQFVFEDGKLLTDLENKRVSKTKSGKNNSFYLRKNGEKIPVRTLSAYTRSLQKRKNRKYSSLSFEDQDSVLPEISKPESSIPYDLTPSKSIEINTPAEQSPIFDSENVLMQEEENNHHQKDSQNQVDFPEVDELNSELNPVQENTESEFFVSDHFSENNQETHFENPIRMESDENKLEQATTNVDVLENPQLNSANQFYGSFAYQANSLFYCHPSSKAEQEFFQCTEDDMEINPEEISFENSASKGSNVLTHDQQQADCKISPSSLFPSDDDFVAILSGEAPTLLGNSGDGWDIKFDNEEISNKPKKGF